MLLGFAAVSAVAQEDTSAYRRQYVLLNRAYVKSPSDIANLVALGIFYSERENPMRSLPQAAAYLRKAETLYIQLVESNTRYHAVLKLIRKQITIKSIRSKAAEVDSLALVELCRRAADMGDDELAAYEVSFPHCEAVVRAARQRLAAASFARVRSLRSIDGLYAFLLAHPGTAEADTAEADLLRLGERYFSQFGDEGSIDRAAERYPASRSLQQSALSLKGRIAFAHASRENTVEAYTSYLERYPRGEDYLAALEKVEELRVAEFGLLSSAVDFADFAEINSDSPLADSAMARLRSMVLDDRSTAAAEVYLSRFPLDPAHAEIYRAYYRWHAAEGNHQPIADFARAHPDYPYRVSIDADLQWSAAADTFDLTVPFREEDLPLLSSCVYRFTGRRIAFVALQRMLQQQMARGDWKGAKERLQKYDICFEREGAAEYRELDSLLSAPNGAKTALLMPPGDSVSHFFAPPEGGRLYFTRRAEGRSTVCYALPSQRKGGGWSYAGDVEVVGAGGDLAAYAFYDDGQRVLVGMDGDIYSALVIDDARWVVSEKLPYPVNTDYSETDAFMLEDGSGLLLASDRPGGHNCQRSGALYHGDHAAANDLYYIPHTPAGWGEAVNLGGTINSPCCERSPLMSRNMKTLYFVTDARGLGYGDVYKATRSDIDDWTSWSRPVNLGRGVNGGFDESAVAFAGRESRLLITTRSPIGGGAGCVSAPAPHDTSSHLCTVRIDTRPVPGRLRRIDVVDINRQRVAATLVGGDIVPLISLLVVRDKPFAALVRTDSVFVPSVPLGGGADLAVLRGYGPERLAKMKEPLPLALVRFAPRTAHLLPMAEQEMGNVAAFLLTHPQCGVEIEVQVAGGDDQACYALSAQRAAALRGFLESSGIETERVRLSPFGNVRFKKNASGAAFAPGMKNNKNAAATEVAVRFF